jgi:hypothetical protein
LVILDLDTYNLRVKLRLTCNFKGLTYKAVKDVVELDHSRILVLTNRPPEYFIVDLNYHVVTALG